MFWLLGVHFSAFPVARWVCLPSCVVFFNAVATELGLLPAPVKCSNGRVGSLVRELDRVCGVEGTAARVGERWGGGEGDGVWARASMPRSVPPSIVSNISSLSVPDRREILLRFKVLAQACRSSSVGWGGWHRVRREWCGGWE